MDVDAQSAHAGGVAGAPPSAEAGASGSIPSSAHASSVTISHASTGAHASGGGKGASSNAMDTDSHAEKHAAGSSTDASSHPAQSGSNGNANKKLYGAFSRYAAAHPIAPISSATSSAASAVVGGHGSKIDVKPSESFDLKSFLAPYEGITIVDRLIYIGGRCSSLAGRAYQMALDELKTTENTTLYRHLVEALSGFPGLHFDMQWMDMKNAQAAQHFERLELELSSYKANLIKVRIPLPLLYEAVFLVTFPMILCMLLHFDSRCQPKCVNEPRKLTISLRLRLSGLSLPRTTFGWHPESLETSISLVEIMVQHCGRIPG